MAMGSRTQPITAVTQAEKTGFEDRKSVSCRDFWEFSWRGCSNKDTTRDKILSCKLHFGKDLVFLEYIIDEYQHISALAVLILTNLKRSFSQASLLY